MGVKEIKVGGKRHSDRVILVDETDYEWLNQWVWNAESRPDSSPYAVRKPKKGGKAKTIRMHRLIMDAPAGAQVDHINGDGLDNRRENLRLCTAQENSRNRKKRENTITPYKGVRPVKGSKRFEAKIYVERKKVVRLGSFASPEEAAKAYNDAAIIYHGEYAYLNKVGV